MLLCVCKSKRQACISLRGQGEGLAGELVGERVAGDALDISCA